MILEMEGLLDSQRRTLLQEALDAAEQEVAIELPLGVQLRLVDGEEIRALNREQRGKDAVTDVLSFPSAEYPPGRTALECPQLLRREYDPDIRACFAGDIVLCLEVAERQAEEYGHSLDREMAYLALHGLAHLFGFDHEEPEEKRAMRAFEERALRRIGLRREEDIMDEKALIAAAKEACGLSYSPYSKYAVGAALLTKEGRVIQGANIENASYGLSLCAERNAIFRAILEGEREFAAICIAAEGAMPYPCGACRQVLSEFCPDLDVIVVSGDKTERTTLRALLPHSFGPHGDE